MSDSKEIKSEAELAKEFDIISKKLFKILNGNYQTKVGVLGSKDARPDEGEIDNAGIGLVQEFGSIKMNIPSRSWLRMPIITKIKMIMKAVQKQKLAITNIDGDGSDVYAILGLACESAIQEAFDTKGFGTWQPNAPFTVEGGWMANPVSGKTFYAKGKKSTTPLIDTGEFRQSITSVVEKK